MALDPDELSDDVVAFLRERHLATLRAMNMKAIQALREFSLESGMEAVKTAEIVITRTDGFEVGFGVARVHRRDGDAAVAALQETPEAPMSTVVHAAEPDHIDDPNRVKVVVDRQGYAVDKTARIAGEQQQWGAEFIQFIPIVERDNDTGYQQGSTVTERSVGATQYGQFLITIFEEWVRRDVGTVYVQMFDVASQQLATRTH